MPYFRGGGAPEASDEREEAEAIPETAMSQRDVLAALGASSPVPDRPEAAASRPEAMSHDDVMAALSDWKKSRSPQVSG
ncbi:MAG: hypothetical protein HQL37_07970 [Alphaproteobacteria bacterium]|nr:hypothetical protein [Alphaproteobacteria bacterium]